MCEPKEEKPFSFDEYKKIADCLKSKAGVTPKVAIICGTGLESIAEDLECCKRIPFDEISNFPKPDPGQKGAFVFGKINCIDVVFMVGRFHFFEGIPLWKIGVPIRVFKLMECNNLIITNTAKGISRNYKLNDFMVIRDHVNFFGLGGVNPLRGPNEKKFGERFPNLNNAYDKDFRGEAAKIAKKMNLQARLKQGSYACIAGPSPTTPAETKMLEKVGVGCVGNSTVAEVIVARHCEMKVFAISLVTQVDKREPSSDNQSRGRKPPPVDDCYPKPPRPKPQDKGPTECPAETLKKFIREMVLAINELDNKKAAAKGDGCQCEASKQKPTGCSCTS